MRRTGFIGLATALLAAAAATGALHSTGVLTSEAVQAPTISLDMDPSGNIYDPATNTMTVGPIDACLVSGTADPATHVHTAHVVVQNVEDLVGWQVRLNYEGDRMRPDTVNFAPFTDNNTGQNISFVNLPIDQTSSAHRDISDASDIPPSAAGPQTAAFGSVYIAYQTFPISPDTPAKTTPDDASYSAPNGGVLASVDLQVVGDQSGQLLFTDMDDGNPNIPGSGVAIFDGTVSHEVLLPETSLGDASHAEGAQCQAPTPTPTAPPPTPTPPPVTPTPTTGPPTPTPGPTPQPGTTPAPPPPGTGGPFDPQVAARYSDTSPASHPDVASLLHLGLGPDGQPGTPDDTGDYNFAGSVDFLPSAPTDAEIPDGAIVGTRQSIETIGILNNSCANQIAMSFTFMEGTTDITNTVDMLPFGIGNELAVIAGDNPPFDGIQAVKPPPAVTKYPSFLNAIFDHDWVDYGPDKIPGNTDDNNGPSPPIKPRSRAVATTWMGFASLWIIAQQLTFEPGTDLPQLPALDPVYGYPSVTVLQTASAAGSATPPIAGPITDSCSATKENSLSYGVSQDNPDTPTGEGGIPLRTLPGESGTPITTVFYAISQRDADGDGYENTIDTCPFHFDAVWNPRDPTQPIEGDGPDAFAPGPVHDGIPDTCDPTPAVATGAMDHDGDGYINRGDNCPLHPNPEQADNDRDANGEVVGDGIGDACDTPGNGPDVPDGVAIVCVRTLTVTVGGPNDAAVSGCLTEVVCADCQPECSCPPPECVCAYSPTPTPPVNLTSTSDSAASAATASRPAPGVAGVAALPRTGDGGGGALSGSTLVLAVAAGVAAATVAVAVRVWKAGRR
jgi:Thrombospondin type 3 repeat